MTEERWPLPDRWEWVHAGALGKIVGGGTPPAGDPTNFSDEDEVPWITPADLTGYKGAYISRGRRNLSKKGLASSGATLMPAGTVLYSSRAPVGYCAIASNPISTNQGFKSLVLREGLVSEFIRYYLLSSKEYAEGLASGTTFKELSGARMAQMLIPLAPEEEQHRIVAKLDSLLARSKSARDDLTHIPKLVTRYKQAVLKRALSGNMTKDWRLQNQGGTTAEDDIRSARSLAVKVRRSKLPTRRLFELEKLPPSWKFANLEDICSKIVDGTHHTPTYLESGVPFISVKDIRDGKIFFDDCKFISEIQHKELARRCDPQVGDLLITKSGTIGRCAIVETENEFSLFVRSCGQTVSRF